MAAVGKHLPKDIQLLKKVNAHIVDQVPMGLVATGLLGGMQL